MRTRSTVLSLAAVATIVLAACGTDATSAPARAVQERLDRGVSVEVTVEADPSAVEDPDTAAGLRDLLDRQADGPLLVASRSGDGQARGLVLAQGSVEARLVDDTAYLRLDTEALAEHGTGLGDALGMPLDDLAGGLGEGSGGEDAADTGMPDLGGLVDALGSDGWIGVSGITPERLAELAGEDPATTADRDLAGLDELLAEQDLDNAAAALDAYTTAEGDGPWEVTVDVRALATALEEVGMSADHLLGTRDAASEGTGDDEHGDLDPANLPERVGGITIEAADGVATRVTIDLATVAQAMADADAETAPDEVQDAAATIADLRAAGARLVLTMVDVGDRADTPTDAAVIDIALVQTLIAGQGDDLTTGLSDLEPEG